MTIFGFGAEIDVIGWRCVFIRLIFNSFERERGIQAASLHNSCNNFCCLADVLCFWHMANQWLIDADCRLFRAALFIV